jgi:hypothetical protein
MKFNHGDKDSTNNGRFHQNRKNEMKPKKRY